jgi:DNA replication factor GINS
VSPGDALTYQELRKRQQLERTSPRLTKLENDFYRHLELYLQSLGEDFQREQGANAGSPKATLLGDELQNTRRLAEDLYENRERKLLTAALTTARGGAADLTHMLKEEQELYEALVALLRETKRRVLHGARGPRPGVPALTLAPSPPPAAVATPAPPEPGHAPPAAPVAAVAAPALPIAAAQAAGRLLVRVLEDVGSFAASDLRTYNVKREDVVSLPADTARILILRGKAVEVAVPG